MNYTISTQYQKHDGSCLSDTTYCKDYTSAIEEFNEIFKKMQNNLHVISFAIILIDEAGNRIKKTQWVSNDIDS